MNKSVAVTGPSGLLSLIRTIVAGRRVQLARETAPDISVTSIDEHLAPDCVSLLQL